VAQDVRQRGHGRRARGRQVESHFSQVRVHLS
jgi:hypothetical protein